MEQKTSLRSVAFAAVVFSTVAVTACLITFPMVFHYVQTLQATVQGEVEYCKSRSRDMWRHMVENGPEGPEEARDVFFRVTRQAESQCCTCQQGPPGPDGQPGRAGKDGAPGVGPGQPGPPGPAPSVPLPGRSGTRRTYGISRKRGTARKPRTERKRRTLRTSGSSWTPGTSWSARKPRTAWTRWRTRKAAARRPRSRRTSRSSRTCGSSWNARKAWYAWQGRTDRPRRSQWRARTARTSGSPRKQRTHRKRRRERSSWRLRPLPSRSSCSWILRRRSVTLEFDFDRLNRRIKTSHARTFGSESHLITDTSLVLLIVIITRVEIRRPVVGIENRPVLWVLIPKIKPNVTFKRP
ncbi:hypothetical protein L596_029612 [Steinernema carpocapsae]|uniref:Nematode cuticle collagen N-terminal domain-containing protein n=1 Tax=Steinernema carpocapsae TaxID=34508 RepID=A0A4U5LV56_STECR|nr:hypothetical protein L596_029612 [Steinernema carpocapsae]